MTIRKRLKRLEERVETQRIVSAILFEVRFVNPNGGVESLLTIGPAGRQEWKEIENEYQATS